MKKHISLIKACMSSDMNLYKIKQKNNNKKRKFLVPLILSLCFMFTIWSTANLLFEKLVPLHMQHIVLSVFVFMTAIMTIIEGIYKTSSLLFNCKDDDLLLSLPIKKSTILFIRIFKFYVFELIFHSIFIIPLVIAYIRWAETLNWTFFLTSFIMLLTLPIIPIVISCILGLVIAAISSRFKWKSLVQTVVSMIMLLGILCISYNLDGFYTHIAKHASSVNELISKIYYPAGLYANLAIKFNIKDLLIYIIINTIIFALTILILSKFYFKINSRLKKITTSKKIKIDNIEIKSKSIYSALIKKELNTFFKTPVFIINAGFGLVLFMLLTIGISTNYDRAMSLLTSPNGFNISQKIITDGMTILVLILLSATSYMTSSNGSPSSFCPHSAPCTSHWPPSGACPTANRSRGPSSPLILSWASSWGYW